MFRLSSYLWVLVLIFRFDSLEVCLAFRAMFLRLFWTLVPSTSDRAIDHERHHDQCHRIEVFDGPYMF